MTPGFHKDIFEAPIDRVTPAVVEHADPRAGVEV